MKKPINIISLSIDNGGTSDTQKSVVDDGKIIGFCIYKTGVNNPGLVQAGLDQNGNEVIPLHTIDNFRNRDTRYPDGYIPVNLDGGVSYTVKIVAEEAFTADTKFQAVFFYDVTAGEC